MDSRFLNRLMTTRRLQTGFIIGLAILFILVASRFAFRNDLLGLIITLGFPALLIVPPLCWLLILHWRKTFYLILLTLVFEGMIRNLTNQVSVLLFKDFLLGLVYLGYLHECGLKFTRQPVFRYFNIAFAVLCCYSLLEMLNPDLPDITVGLIGLKTLLFYIPLIYVAYEVIDSPRKVQLFAVIIFGLTFISCLVGIYQYLGGREVIQAFLPGKVVENYGSAGELVSYKLPGTFASASNFSGLLYISFSLAMGLLYSKTSRALTLLSLFTVALTSLMFVFNSQRAGLVYVLLCFLLGTFSYSTTNWLRFLRIALAALLIVAFVIAISTDDNAIGTRFAQFTASDGLQAYLVNSPLEQIDSQLQEVANGRLFGLGIGSGAPGARYILGDAYVFVESFIALLLFELGPIGLILTGWLIAIMTWLSWRAYRDTKANPLHNLTFYSFIWLIYMLLTSITYAPTTVPPASHFFWLVPGIALSMQARTKALKAPPPGLLGPEPGPGPETKAKAEAETKIALT
jgi:hypothetical protein